MQGVDQILSAHYIWLFIGLFLFLLELLFSGYFFIFFSIGALFASLVSILFHPGLTYQLIIFFSTSLISLMIIRTRIKVWAIKANQLRAKTNRVSQSSPGTTAIAYTDIIPGKVGEIKVNTEIKETVSKDKIKKGDVVKLIRTDKQVFEVKFMDRF